MIKDEKEFLAVAMRAYDNPSCVDVSEFESDLRKIQYCKKLLRKFHTNDDPNFRLLLNNLIVFYNLFGTAGTDLLLYKIKDAPLRAVLVPFVIYLGHATNSVLDLPVNIDEDVVELLRQL